MFKKGKEKSSLEEIFKTLKKSTNKKIVVICKQEIKERIEMALNIKYGRDKIVFLDVYTEDGYTPFEYTDQYIGSLRAIRKKHEIYNIQDKIQAEKQAKNGIPMLATDNIYFDPNDKEYMVKIIEAIDKVHQEIENGEMIY